MFRILVRLITNNRSKSPARRPMRPAERPRPKPTVQPEGHTVRPAPQTSHFKSSGRTLKGKCYVIDGDTIVISGTHIRLAGIDAPELHHPWGNKAKWAMVNLCKGQVIRAELEEDPSYDRNVATCYLPDGRDLSAELVKQGLALDWPRFSQGKYADLEEKGVRKRLWRAAAKQAGRLPAHEM